MMFCLSVTLVRFAKVAGPNKMSFNTDTRVVSNTVVLNTVPSSSNEKEIFRGSQP